MKNSTVHYQTRSIRTHFLAVTNLFKFTYKKLHYHGDGPPLFRSMLKIGMKNKKIRGEIETHPHPHPNGLGYRRF